MGEEYDEGSGTLAELPDRPCVVRHHYASESGKTWSRWSVDGKLMPEEWSPMEEEELVTITKAQLLKLTKAMVHPTTHYDGECYPIICRCCWTTGKYLTHTPDCELPALEELCR